MHPMPGTTWGHATQKTKWSGRPLRGSLPAERCAHLHLLPASSWLLVWKDTDAHEPRWTLRCLGSELRMPKLQDGILGSDDTMRLPCHPTLPAPWLLGWERESSFPLVKSQLQGTCCCMLWSPTVTGVPLSFHRPLFSLQNSRCFLLLTDIEEGDERVRLLKLWILKLGDLKS